MRPIPVFVALLSSATAMGQCAFSTFLTAHCYCAYEPPYYDYVVGVGVSFFGGTPPYTYQISTNTPFNLWQTGSTSASGIAFPDPIPPNVPSINYYSTVTDANGCVSTQGPVVSPPWRRLDPNAMTRTYIPGATTWILRMTGGISPISLGLNLDYTLYSGTTVIASGQLGAIYNSVQNSLDLSALPPGSYRFVISTVGLSSPAWCQANTDLLFTLPQMNDVGVNVQMSAALRGPMAPGAQMIDSLRAKGVLPAMEPYSAMGYVYQGTTAGAMMNPSLPAITGTQAVVDWMVLELRSSSAPYAVIASRPALIRRDGEVVDLDGDPYVNFPGLAPGNYRASLRHRNHLGAMSSIAVALQVIPARFTLRNGGAYGTNPLTSIFGVSCLWPGDVNFDGTVKYAGGANDRDPILTLIGGTTPTNTVNNVYNGGDLNLDGKVKYAGSANDRDIILQTIGGSVPTATRVQQLP